MPTNNFRVQLTRGTTALIDSYIGRPGEVSVDLEKKEFRVLDGVTAGGVFSIGAGGTDSLTIQVDDFSGSGFVLPNGVTVTKVYSNSSLQITHNKGKYPKSWFGFNKETSPFTGVLPSSTVNMQIVDTNTIILTSISGYNTAEYSLIF